MRIVMLTGDNAATAHAVAREARHHRGRGRRPRRKTNTASSRAQAAGRRRDGRRRGQRRTGTRRGRRRHRDGHRYRRRHSKRRHHPGKGDLAGIVRARTLSRTTMRNIRENLVFAFAYNAIGIPIAAGVLYPAFGLLLSPMVAALAMSFSSVSVIANALRLAPEALSGSSSVALQPRAARALSRTAAAP